MADNPKEPSDPRKGEKAGFTPEEAAEFFQDYAPGQASRFIHLAPDAEEFIRNHMASEAYGAPEEILQTGITGKPYEPEPVESWSARMLGFQPRKSPPTPRESEQPQPEQRFPKGYEILVGLALMGFGTIPLEAPFKVALWAASCLVFAHVAYRYFQAPAQRWRGPLAAIVILALEALIVSGPAKSTLFPPASLSGASEPLVALGQYVKLVRGDRPDNFGHVVFTVPFVNQTARDLKVYLYGVAQVQPFVPVTSDDAIVKSQALAVKDAVRQKYAKHDTAATMLRPGSAAPGGWNETTEIIGPYVTDAQWKIIKSGKLYVYLYALAAINDDAATSVRVCRIAIGDQIPPIECEAGLEDW